jgi:hypothetical protein
VRVAIADLDGDGRPELVGADADRVVAIHLDGTDPHDAPAQGAPQRLCAGRVGDAQAVVVGFGEDRLHRGAPARLCAYRWERGGLVAETIAEPTTGRAEIATLRLCDWPGRGPGVLFGIFDSKYFVRLSFATRQGGRWQSTDLGRVRMASAADLAHGPDGPRLVVGRLYGDNRDADGDVYLAGLDGSRLLTLPTTRGVRALVAGDRDVFVADGWDRSYEAKARGLVTRIRLSDQRATLVEDTPGQFMLTKLELCDLDGDGPPELVGLGTRYLRVWRRRGDRFAGRTIANTVPDFAAAPGLVLLGGARPELLRFGPAHSARR